MENGKLVAGIATTLLFVTCSRPNLTGIADGVVMTMNGISTNLNTTLRGGFTLGEAKACQKEPTHIEDLELPTNSIVNIEIKPNTFYLEASKSSWHDTDDVAKYRIDLDKRTLQVSIQGWLGWTNLAPVSLPPAEDEIYISKADDKQKIKLDFENPFELMRPRLGVRLGLTLMGNDPKILLSDRDAYGAFCAGALNFYYEALMKTKYKFKR
jgi:hypothetical protein